MREIRPDHVAIYIRWSTDDQSAGTTLEVQTQGCRHYALSQGWVPRDDLMFIDDGYSGGSLDRPALSRLRQLVQGGEVDCIVVFKVDRLSRNIVDAVDLVLGEWKETCYFKSAREPIDTASDLGRVIFGILAMFADFERSQIRERTLSGKVRRIAEGRQLHGEAAFGYRPSGRKGQWAEAPEEAAVVRRIFRMAADGESASSICRQLNADGLRTRAGNAWHIRGVLWILHNRVYIGEAVYGVSQLKAGPTADQTTRTRRIRRSEPLVHTATQAAPALVTADCFAKAGAAIARKAVARRECGSRSLSSRHLLVGLARCRCGGTLVAKRQGQHTNYVCHNIRAGRCGCGPGHIDQRKADQIILAQFLATYGPQAIRAEWLRAVAQRQDAHLSDLRAQRATLTRERTRLDEQETRLLRSAYAGEVDLSDLKDLRRSLGGDRTALDVRLQAMQCRITEIEAGSRRVEAAIARLNEGAGMAATRLAGLPTDRKRELLRMALAGPLTIFKAKGTHLIEIDASWAH